MTSELLRKLLVAGATVAALSRAGTAPCEIPPQVGRVPRGSTTRPTPRVQTTPAAMGNGMNQNRSSLSPKEGKT